MAAERPDNAEERLVSEALQRAFGEPVPPAAFLAGREAVLAAAAIAAEEAAADAELVTAALTGAFAVPVDPDVRTEHVAAIRAAAQRSNVIPLRRVGQRVGRHAVAAMVAVSSLAGGTGVAAASSDAVPGQALYPVKRVVEQAMLTAAWTPGAEARVQAKLAARRLVEAEVLLASGASPDLVAPLLSAYDEHVAAVQDLAVTSASVQVAVLEEKAEALREQAVVAVLDDGSADPGVAAVEPTETTSPPAITTTEVPTASASEATTTQDEAASDDPTPAPSAASATRSEPASSGSAGQASAPNQQPQQQPAQQSPTRPSPSPSSSPSPSPSAQPTPTATPTPDRPSQSEVNDSSTPPPGQAKPKPENTDKDANAADEKPDPKPTSKPTPDPKRAPLSDSEPLNDAGPLHDSEERSHFAGS